MSKRVRHRHQRQRIYYQVLWPNGTLGVISAEQFIAGVAAGTLIRDPNDKRLARVPSRLTLIMDPATAELIFRARSRPALTETARTSTEPLRRKWLESERTLTSREARRRMLIAVPRVNTGAVCLY